MAKKKPKPRQNDKKPRVGKQILQALTEDEVAQLLDSVFSTLLAEARNEVLEGLARDTARTVRQLLEPPRRPKTAKAARTRAASLAKLEQTWDELWEEWANIVFNASEEDGPYMEQDEPWHAPYLNEQGVVDDLEKVAQRMLPLLPAAFEHGFSPDGRIAEALVEAEIEIAGGIPEWIEIVNGFYLEKALTNCVLEWEMLLAQQEGGGLISVAESLRQYQKQWKEIVLGEDALVDFFVERPETELERLWKDLHAAKSSPVWKEVLHNVESPWHLLYLELLDRFDPQRRLKQLRATLSQQWTNGLPVIRHFLEQTDYAQASEVLQATLRSLLCTPEDTPLWTPEDSLLVENVHGFVEDSCLELLQLYREAARGLGETRRVRALEIQIQAWTESSAWQPMLEALKKPSLPKKTREALFASWKKSIVLHAQPYGDYASSREPQEWWLHWLLDSFFDPRKGRAWFQKKLDRWLSSLPEKEAGLGVNLNLLRLLTNDATLMEGRKKSANTRFFEVVIRPVELSSKDDSSRREFLKRVAPPDLLDRLMVYWKQNLHVLVPQPEEVYKSDYTTHARWMTALKELSEERYQALLATWRIEHKRRRNLWKALENKRLI